ncbi:MAG: response regulator transcription factor [Novosphingobium sp.]|nr:MAG: response regulator transcription factor [Alphaproteobacteria bacterium]
MTRILVVDDEPAIRRLLSGILERGGYQVELAENVREAISAVERSRIDAVLLDLGLPDRDGLEAISAIRTKHDVPIIVVTARDDTAEKIAALDLGADDYVTKPFDCDELLARLRSALRRSGKAGSADAVLTFGPVMLDTAHHRATCREEPVMLTPREFSVLATLMEAGGRILTHAAILERVWGKAHVGDIDYLRVVIRALRLKLEIDPSQPVLIRNEPGIGYRLMECPSSK